MTNVTSLVNSVWDLMTSNPLLSVFLAAGMLSVGVMVFGMIKNAARS